MESFPSHYRIIWIIFPIKKKIETKIHYVEVQTTTSTFAKEDSFMLRRFNCLKVTLPLFISFILLFPKGSVNIKATKLNRLWTVANSR